MKHIFLCLTAFVSIAASEPVFISEAGKPSAADRAEIEAQETKIFAGINSVGAYATISALSGSNLPAQALADLKKIDAVCGKMKSAERVASRNVGSFYFEDSLAAVHEGCLMKWDFRFAKEKGVWKLRFFNFNTPDRGW